MTSAEQKYIEVHQKSQLAGFLLAFLLGPLGLFYSHPVAACVLLVIAVVGFATVIVPVLCWLASWTFSFYFVSRHNEKLEAEARLKAS